MSNLPESAGRGHLRVSDADREQAAEVLRTAAGDGRITFDELDERLSAAYAARTYGDLAQVTADLPGPGLQPPTAVDPAPGTFPATRIGGAAGPTVSIAIMSGVERAGPWVLPPRHTCFAMMGGIQLDLREARFSQREVTIDAYTLMGGIDIIVGEDIEVDISGFGIMGGFDHRASGPGLPGAPRLRVYGFALMGGVNVQRRGPKKRKKRQQQGLGGQPTASGELGGQPGAGHELGGQPTASQETDPHGGDVT
jgi:Domain of unknown function (DUF1707)